jgi:hypothetical protein
MPTTEQQVPDIPTRCAIAADQLDSLTIVPSVHKMSAWPHQMQRELQALLKPQAKQSRGCPACHVCSLNAWRVGACVCHMGG